jgi:hypothetical protein
MARRRDGHSSPQHDPPWAVGRLRDQREVQENLMRKITALFVSAALCTPAAVLAQDYNTDLLDAELLTTEFTSQDECEDALAQARRDLRAENEYVGRDRGQSNKAFNQRYECVDGESDGTYVIVDEETDA